MKKFFIEISLLTLVYLGLITSLVTYAATIPDTGELSIEILPGIDTIYAPYSITHSYLDESPNQQESDYLWDQNSANQEFIEFEMGSGSTDIDITASIGNNFLGQNHGSTFNAETTQIKACKDSGYCSTDNWPEKEAGHEVPDNCIVFTPGIDTIFTELGPTGVTLVDDGIGGIGSNCTMLFGVWRFIPATKIILPANTPPDIYISNLNFTLTTR
jgi:hypothetical protein